MEKIIEICDLKEAIIQENDQFCLTNVKITGIKSENKREYPIEVLRKSMHLYEGKPVYIGHNYTSKKRLYTERIGFVKNVRVKENGLYGDLQLNPKHSLSEQISWDWANNTKSVGLSHDATGNTVNGRITELFEVNSIDLVCDPASTQSLREEIEKEIEQDKKEFEEVKVSLKETLNKITELTEQNVRLLQEVQELKNRKPVYHNPLPEAPKELKVDLKDWVNSLKRKN